MHKKHLRFKWIFPLLLLILMIVPQSFAEKLLEDPILTESGYVSGTTHDAMHIKGLTGIGEEYEALIGEIGKKIRIYRGIPYAAPPVGELRWKPPQPVEPWDYIRESTQFSPMAPQPYPASSVYGSIREEGMSEDCLYLNIQTPAKGRRIN